MGLADERQRRLVLDSLLLGVVGALAAQAFIFLLDLADKLLIQGIAGYYAPGLPNEGGKLVETIGSHGLWLVPLVTTLGGLIVGILIYSLAPEADGHGTDAAIKAVHRTGGYLRPRVVPLKMVASAITIGSGGAAGREGPASLIAAGLGSIYGTIRHRSEDERRLLVIIGMAAGLSAVFRTPIGAAVFAIEVLYSEMEFETDALLYAILASVVAFSLNGAVSGWEPLFNLPSNMAVSGLTMYLECAVIGVAGGVVGAMLPVALYRTRDIFHAMRIPPHVKPAIGGLLLGLMALVWPQILGGGYGWMQEVIDGGLGWKLMLALVVMKTVAFSLTIGSGGSGGVLAPGLFVGTMLGGVFADIFHQSPATFALVGMAGVFGSAGRVPIATLFMVAEMTGGYRLLPATALVVALSSIIQMTLVAGWKYSTLHEAQIPTRTGRDVDLLEGVQVKDVMSTDLESVPPDMPIANLLDEFQRTHHHGFTVLDKDNNLLGVITVGDIERAVLTDKTLQENKTVADIATVAGLAVGYPDETMSVALWRMGVRGIGRLPIVERGNHRHVVGLIHRENVIRAYEQAVARRTYTSYRLKELREAHEGNVRVVEVDINDRHPLAGQSVREIARNLPSDCILVSIRRGKRLLIPHGDTVIQPGDHLVSLASDDAASQAQRLLAPVR
ncbi:MAG TPA: chloride channel protein [Aggregatilinea sp.]|uniref:chloride channel protein n=1 Tax=Aggregatilinea sp. TaxID=2806333 RepID=UPI002C63E4BD|nr:chloride channel protein [Aggregatilinea sp.]HML22336.1 chloride channel protein [Aggregatilinea sp.]